MRARRRPLAVNPKDLIGLKKVPLRLLPAAFQIHTAYAMLCGARKYGEYNWRKKAVRLMVYIEAAMRHLLALLDGEDKAPDSGCYHASHVAACMAIILDAMETGNLIDDRIKGPAGRLIEQLSGQKPVNPYAKTRRKPKKVRLRRAA